MNNPLVSIIVPCYNQAVYLPDTINSIIKQTYENWECIIINDGSLDNTQEIAEFYVKLDKRICLLSQENKGVAMARNNGIANSFGEYILPLDSDDLIESTYIEKAISYFMENQNTKLVYCKADRFDKKREYWDLPEYSYEKELWQNVIFCSAIFKRSDYNKTIGYNPNMKGGIEDWDFWLSFLKKGDVVYRIPEVLFHYRFKKKSRSTEADKRKEALYRQIYHNHKDLYEEYVPDIVLYKNKLLSYELLKENVLINFLIFVYKCCNKIKRMIMFNYI